MNIWTDLLLLLAGFVLTTVVGGGLTFWFHQLSWRRQARLELFRQRYADGLKFVSDLMKLIDRRVFRLQQVIWALEGKASQERLKSALDSYYASVTEWNESLHSSHTYLQLLVGLEFGKSFLDFDDERRETPRSLHYAFVAAHRFMLEAKTDASTIAAASAASAKLNIEASAFCLALATQFHDNAGALFNLNIKSERK